MFDIDSTIIILLVVFGFIAAFVDSVVGGGGLITLPALLFTGLPPATAIATNKLASSIGSFTSSVVFFRSGKLDKRLVAKLFPVTFVFAMLGAYSVHLVNPDLLKPFMLVMLAVVAVYTIFKKDWGQIEAMTKVSRTKLLLFVALIGLIGFYDGFLGPGTGSFLMFTFLWFGADFLKAAGNAKVLNFASNFAALLMFIYLGEVIFSYGLIMGVAQIFGSIAGSRFALKRGSGYVRILFIVMTLLLLAKHSYDYFQSL
ncbi:TSUP family transporter [Planococcaceae bacterium Storch 2/2-2]|nr:TSUP family transporter [Planococcaceae bacterium Storch 2/2-2]